MQNGVRKNGDAHLYSHESGKSTKYPGVVCETDYSDPLKKSRRDITLWLEYSDCEVQPLRSRSLISQVKCGIVSKIATNPAKAIQTLIFEIWTFDSTSNTRASPLGRAKKEVAFVFTLFGLPLNSLGLLSV